MSVEELSAAPSMARLYPRVLAASFVRPALRHVPGLGASADRGLPERELVLPAVTIDRDHLAAYDRVCGFRLRDELPPTYLHMLAFPLAMALMTDGQFPFSAIGLLHIRNRIEQLRPVGNDERVALRVRFQDLRPHDRGTQFDVITEATVDAEPVWRGTSVYLHRERGGEGSSGAARKSGEREQRAADPPARAPEAVWRVPADTGRRYAAVSGDRNPIHLHPLTSRLFGQPRPIAHGMWTKARCLAALEGVLSDRFAVDVRFKLPIVLPATVGFASWLDGDARRIAVSDRDSGRPHLSGSVERAGD